MPTGPLNLLPASIRSQMEKHRETIRFLVVGGTCFLITNVVTYLLKFTIMNAKPVTALIIGTVVATIVSYFLNREWSFSTRGGRSRHMEMLLFIVVNLIGIGINSTPQYISRYAFHLDEAHYSLAVQEVADFASGMILGTALAMVFRLWAFRAWVFPHQLEETDPGQPAVPAQSAVADNPSVHSDPVHNSMEVELAELAYPNRRSNDCAAAVTSSRS